MTRSMPARYILPDYTFEKGEPAAALAASPHRVSGTLRIGGQEHFYLEGQVALAVPGEDEMLVYSSTQHPSELQHIIAHMLEAAGGCGERRGAAHGRRASAARKARPRNGRRSPRWRRASPGARARSGSIATTTCR